MRVEVRKGGSKSLQSGVKWVLCSGRFGGELVSVRSCPDPQRMSCAPGPGYPVKDGTAWLASPAHSCAWSYSFGNGPAARPHSGEDGLLSGVCGGPPPLFGYLGNQS